MSCYSYGGENYSSSSNATISVILSNICYLILPQRNINFGTVTINQLNSNDAKSLIIPLSIYCQGSYNNQSLSLSFIPKYGHYGLPTSGILTTNIKNLGIKITTASEFFSKSSINGINTENNQLITFYLKYKFILNHLINLKIKATPIAINKYEPVDNGLFQSELNIILNYN